MFHSAECIGKSWQFLYIPGGLLDGQLILTGMYIGQQGHDREQAEQRRGHTQDGEVRPLTLSLHAEVSADFVERDFHLPTLWKPFHDLLGGNGEIGAQQGLGLELLPWVADDDPTNGHGRLSGVRPHRGPGSDFDQAFLFAIPLMHRELLPTSAFIFGNLFQSRQAFALLARATHLVRSILSRLVQRGVHAKADDNTNRIFQLTQVKKQLNHGKTAVGDHDQLSLGQPTASLQDHLPSPLGELLMLARAPCLYSTVPKVPAP